MISFKISPYRVNWAFHEKKVDFQVPFLDGSVRVKECDVLVRADDEGVGYVDIQYDELRADGRGTVLSITLHEENNRKLCLRGDRVVYGL